MVVTRDALMLAREVQSLRLQLATAQRDALIEAADDIDAALFDEISVKQVNNVAVFSDWLRKRAEVADTPEPKASIEEKDSNLAGTLVGGLTHSSPEGQQAPEPEQR